MNARTTMSAKGQVVIPKDVRDMMGFKPGQSLDVVQTGGGILLRPATSKSGKSTADIVSELRKMYRHEGPPVSIEEMNQAVDTMLAAKWRDEV